MPIRVEGKDEYKHTHGHSPRGWGFWDFSIAGKTRSFSGTFSEAQKAAKDFARANHPKVISIKVLT